MKTGKAIGGSDGIPIEVWRRLDKVGVSQLTRLFNTIFSTNKMSNKWRKNTLAPIYKNK